MATFGRAARFATDGEDGEPPLVPAAPFGHLRLRRADCAPGALARWAEEAWGGATASPLRGKRGA